MNKQNNSSSYGTIVLGLDLGPTSIGWALLDETHSKVVATGARVFPEGIDRDPRGGEKSRSQTRREKRTLRRQIRRRSNRLDILRRALAEAKLLPAATNEQNAVLRTDPYPLRAKALDERLDPFELGRLLYHLAQRRGFLSNRKSDRAKGSDAGVVMQGIAGLQAEMLEASARTLGEYLASLAAERKRVRNRYTHRSMYEEEFETIWEKQQHYHPGLLTETAKYGSQQRNEYPCTPDRNRRRSTESHLERYGIHGIIFFQRRVYWPASVTGRCELEPGQKRCPRADRLAQRFRIVQDANNVRYRDPATGLEHSLTPDQRCVLVDYLMEAASRSFKQIRKHLAKSGVPEDAEFNFEQGGRSKLKGNETDAALQNAKCLGKKKWLTLDEETRNEIVDIISNEQLTDREMLELLQRECALTPGEAEAAMSANIPDGHASLSRLAISKLLPFMEQGLQLMGKDKTDSALFAAGYLPLETGGAGQTLGPVPGGITNPIVRQALYEARKVVNAIIRRYGRPDMIRIELAREAKKSFVERKKILFENKQRERERAAAAERLIEDAGIQQPRRGDILKYRLWQEAEGICVYCDQAIGIAQLSNGEANVDHILPRWRSLDDSYMNKVICHRTCNSDKGDRTPCEWLEDADPERYALVTSLAKRLPYPKRHRFAKRDLVLNEFVGRHLSDTTYISRLVKDYLQTLGLRVDCSRGTITAELRRFWGLNTILFPEGQGEKTRNDHRHHAVDAAVTALATPSRLQQLARARGGNSGREVQPPWPGLRDDLACSVEQINVSHRPRRRISGALHEDTFYGRTEKLPEHQRQPQSERPWAKDWVEEDENLYVRRKPVTEITKPKHLASVRDRAIREILTTHLRERDVDLKSGKDFPRGIFEGDDQPCMPSGTPIHRVRMVERLNTARKAGKRRGCQFVQPGSNHHICYYESIKPGKPRWQARVTTMWDAAVRVRRDGLPPVDTGECELGRFVMSLSIGESFTVEDGKGGRQLCVVRKIDQTGRIHYRLHRDARKAGELAKENLYFSPEKMRSLHAAKVAVDSLGTVRRSGD